MKKAIGYLILLSLVISPVFLVGINYLVPMIVAIVLAAIVAFAIYLIND